MTVPQPRTLIGSAIALLGVLLALNGLVSGPYAFWLGWQSVIGSVIAGLLLLLSGVLVLRGPGRPAFFDEPADVKPLD